MGLIYKCLVVTDGTVLSTDVRRRLHARSIYLRRCFKVFSKAIGVAFHDGVRGSIQLFYFGGLVSDLSVASIDLRGLGFQILRHLHRYERVANVDRAIGTRGFVIQMLTRRVVCGIKASRTNTAYCGGDRRFLPFSRSVLCFSIYRHR